MYSDIGKKIKAWAKIIFIAGAAITVVFGIIYMIIGPRNMANDSYYGVKFSAAYPIFKGILIMLLGPVCSLLASVLVYGFGQMVDDIAFLRTKEDPDNKYSEISIGAAFKEGVSSVGGMFKSAGGVKKRKTADVPALAQVLERAKSIENDDALRDYLESARAEYISSGDYRSASQLLVMLHSDDLRAAVENFN